MSYEEKLENVSCDLCGGNDTKLLFTTTDKTSSGQKVPFSVVRCKKCRLIYVNPRPQEDSLKDYYPKDYYSHQADPLTDRFLDSTVTKIALNKFYGYKNLDVKHIKRSDIFLSFFKRRQLENIPLYVKEGRALDIGCGNGAYLYKLKQLGWQTFGVEIDENACKHAEQILGQNIFNGNLLKANFEDKYFDVITIWHTLEHLPDPAETLLEIRRILKDKGVLFIGVPNAGSVESKIFKSNWSHFDVPRHLYNFSEKTLKQFLFKTGFKILRTKHCTYGSYGFLGSFDNALQSVNRKSRLRDNPTLALVTKIPYSILVLFRQSGCIEVIAAKEAE